MVIGMVKVWVLGKGEGGGKVCSCVHVHVLSFMFSVLRFFFAL